MRVLVVSAFEALSPLASTINTVKMAQGFARLGHEVTIVCRQTRTGKASLERLEAQYGLTERLKWVQLPQKILKNPIDPHWRFSLLALPILFSFRPSVVFARSYIFPYLSSLLHVPTIAESHAHVNNKTAPFLRMVHGTQHPAFRTWVTISKLLAEYYYSLGVPLKKLLVLPDAVDLHLFKRPEVLPLSPYSSDITNVAYVGHLYDYKGIPTVLETAGQLPKIHFHFIGGLQKDIERQQQRAEEMHLKNVIFHGNKPQTEVPPFLWHADALLLPPSQHHPSAAWTSPVKLGEYLASETPVVATEIPALRDWLTDSEVRFVQPDSPKTLREGILDVIKDTKQVDMLRKAGIKKAHEWSYMKRAKRILAHCGARTDDC